MNSPSLRSSLRAVEFPAFPDSASAILVAVLDQLDASQWWPEATLRRHQQRQLAALLRHARATVPYYADILAGVRLGATVDPDEWRTIPLLTKAQIRAAGDALHSRAVPAALGGVQPVWTSGSTGTPLRLLKTRWSQGLTGALSAREALWHRRDLGAKLASLHAPGMHVDAAATVAPSGEREAAWPDPLGSLFHTGPRVRMDYRNPVEVQAEFLIRENPAYLSTVPSNLRALLGWFRAAGRRIDGLRQVRTMSELLTPETRAACRDVLGVDIADCYGATETGPIAFQCPAGEHHHVQSEACYVEVLDEHDRPAAPGAVGRAVVTALHDHAMPLIRYDISDNVVLGGPCACGRGLPVLARLFGKTRNLLTLPSGAKRFSLFGGQVFHDATAVRQWQIAQRSLTLIEARLVVDRALSAAEEASIRRALQAQLGAEFEIRLAYVERIGTGLKFEEFVSEVDPA